MPTERQTPPTGAGRGFTLVEMLVVIAIIAVALSVLLPAFARVLQSNNYAAARNTVQAALTRVSQAGVDGGLAFLYTPPRDGRLNSGVFTLQPLELDYADATLVSAGTPGYTGPRIPAAAYRPSTLLSPTDLPGGAAVFGLSFMHDDPQRLNPQPPAWARWYAGYTAYGQINSEREMTQNHWLFPRSHVQYFVPTYDPLDYNSPAHPCQIPASATTNPWQFAETFFVRFDREGRMLGSAGGADLPRNAYIEFPNLPYNPTRDPQNPERYTVLPPSGPVTGPEGRALPVESRREFDPQKFYYASGSAPVLNPEVKMRAVDQVAVVDFADMIAETGIEQPWYVRPTDPLLPPTPPDKTRWVSASLSVTDESQNVIRRISRYVDEKGEVLSFGRYTGQVVKR